MTPLTFPNIDPIIFSIGPIHVRWYGFMYVLGFMASYHLAGYQITKHQYRALKEQFENLNFILILFTLVGGRLGYVLFYNFSYYLKHPLEIPATWGGGMSFHGACLALLVAGAIFCHKKKIDFWTASDIYTATIPIGLGLGRIGNFINGELVGRVTDVSWGIVFPFAGPLPRHPSQLYEAVLEGVVLFTLLWSQSNKPWQNKRYWPHGSITALFLIGYGIIRMFVENFREPDAQIGFLWGALTMGQLLSGIMVAAGLIIWLIQSHRTAPQSV